MSALKPGMYRATVRDVPDTIVFVDGAGYGRTADYVLEEWREHNPHDITDARPLIVLDLGNPAAFVSLLRSCACSDFSDTDSDDLRLYAIADQIEAQTKPARIPDPGWDGKVTSRTSDNSKPRVFLHFGTVPEWANWVDEDSHKYLWDDLIDPALIREGIQ